MTGTYGIARIPCLLLIGLVAAVPAEADPSVSEDRSSYSQDTARVNKLNKQASRLISQGRQEKADSLIRIAGRLSDSLDYRKGKARAVINRGDYFLSIGRYDTALTLLESAYRQYQEPPARLELGNLLATAHRYNGNLNRVLGLYTRLLQTAREQNKERMAAGIEENLAVVLQSLGDRGAAMKHHLSSLKQMQALGDSSAMATILNNIGNLSRNMGNYKQAEQYLKEALAVSKQIGQDITRSNSLLNLGIVYSRTGELQKARTYFQKTLDLARKMGRIAQPVQIKYNFGDLYFHQGKLDSAYRNYRHTLSLSRKHNLIQGYFYGNYGLGRVAAARENYMKAESLLNQALKVARKMGDLSLQRDALKKLHQVMGEAANYEKAYAYLKSYKSINDSLTASRQQQKIARYKTQFGLRQQKRKNRLLEAKLKANRRALWIGGGALAIILLIGLALFWMYRKKQKAHQRLLALNDQINDQKKELEELNETKDQLLSVLAHDLRNPITSIQQVASLFREDVLSKEDVREIATQTETQLQHSINTLENMLTWAQEQTIDAEPDLKTLNLKSKVEKMVDELRKQAEDKQIEIINRIDSEIQITADEDMLDIILRNLATNAIKYVQKGDLIEFDAKTKRSRKIISVCDTGPGIPEEMQKQLFEAFGKSTKGTWDERGMGLGLSLCKEYAEKQGGNIWFESEDGEGTCFFVEFPD